MEGIFANIEKHLCLNMHLNYFPTYKMTVHFWKYINKVVSFFHGAVKCFLNLVFDNHICTRL